MVESYKIPSKITNLIVFLAAFIVYVGKDELAKILPVEYAYLAPIIVLIAGYIAAQKTEDKRVERAEQIIESKYTTEEECPAAECEDLDLNEDYSAGEEDGI